MMSGYGFIIKRRKIHRILLKLHAIRSSIATRLWPREEPNYRIVRQMLPWLMARMKKKLKKIVKSNSLDKQLNHFVIQA